MTLAVIALFAVLLGLICFRLAVEEVNGGVFTAQPSSQLPYDLLKGVVTDSEYTISEKELNDFAAYLIEQSNDSVDDTKDSFILTDLYIDLKEGDTGRCYLRVKKGSVSFDIAADCKLESGDGEFVASIDNATVGKLPVPESVLKLIFERTALEIKSAYISADEPALHIPTHFGMELPELSGYGELISLDIISADISDDSITVKTNPVLTDALTGFFEAAGNALFN